MHFGVCGEGISAGAMVDSGKNLPVNIHDGRLRQSLVETGGSGMDALWKVLVRCLGRQLPRELRGAQLRRGLWQKVVFAFPKFSTLGIFCVLPTYIFLTTM